MLHDTKSAKHGMLVSFDLLHGVIGNVLLEELLSVNFSGGMQVGLSLSVLFL